MRQRFSAAGWNKRSAVRIRYNKPDPMKATHSTARLLLSFLLQFSLCLPAKAALPQGVSHTVATVCAEEDNVQVELRGQIQSFVMEATHPAYALTPNISAPDFTGCGTPADAPYLFTPGVIKLFDNGVTVVEAVREAAYWRPTGMQATVAGAGSEPNVHYLRFYRRITDAGGYPQFFVIYSDGNTRMIPQPPAGLSEVTFGSSVIVGPATTSGGRSIAEISSATYDPGTDQLTVTYASGGTAAFTFAAVNRTQCTVRVDVGYATSASTPFAVFTSMYVAEDKCDAAYVGYEDAAGVYQESGVMSFTQADSATWSFLRKSHSLHNTSAPNITVYTRHAAARRASLLFQNGIGQMSAWNVVRAGAGISGATVFAAALGDWRVRGRADLNGDGFEDIILQNGAGQIVAWYLNGGGSVAAGGFLSSGFLGDWKVAGTADINMDGKVDLVLQNNAGQIAVWHLDGAGAVVSGRMLSPGALGDWRIAGTVDINGDGFADIVFQNNVGQIAVWNLDGAGQVAAGSFLYPGFLGDWRVASVTDLNGDGHPDVVLQNGAGSISVWFLTSAGIVASGSVLFSGSLGDWRVR